MVRALLASSSCLMEYTRDVRRLAYGHHSTGIGVDASPKIGKRRTRDARGESGRSSLLHLYHVESAEAEV